MESPRLKIASVYIVKYDIDWKVGGGYGILMGAPLHTKEAWYGISNPACCICEFALYTDHLKVYNK